MMQCPHCGASVAEGSKFCAECGERLEVNHDEATQGVAGQQDLQAMAPNPVNAAQVQGRTHDNALSPKMAVPLIVVLSLAAGGFGALLYSKTLSAAAEPPAQSTPEPTVEEGDPEEASSEQGEQSEEGPALELSDLEALKVQPKETDAGATSEVSTNGEAPAATEDVQEDASTAAVPDASAAANEASAASFPRTWHGSYEGHDGNNVYTRPITFTFDTVQASGELYGTVQIVVQEANPDERVSTYYVAGSVDWDSGEFYVEGTSWVAKGDLDVMRCFDGVVDFSSYAVSGTTWNLEGENYQQWRASA